MNKSDSYEEVMKELDYINDLIEIALLEPVDADFKFEYAFESITESGSAYKRRNYES